MDFNDCKQEGYLVTRREIVWHTTRWIYCRDRLGRAKPDAVE